MNLNSQNQFYFIFFTLLGHIVSVNNVVVTVLYLLRALHRRIIVYLISYIILIISEKMFFRDLCRQRERTIPMLMKRSLMTGSPR